MRRIKPVSIKVHPDFYNNIMEPQRRKMQKKGIKKISQVNLSKMIEMNLKSKRRTLGLQNARKKRSKKKKR